MFRVVFIKHIFDAADANPKARFAVLTREEMLPFAPTPGHEVAWPMDLAQRISSSTWNCDEQKFMCRIDDEFTVNLDVDAFDFNEYIDDAPSRGWRVVNVYEATR